MIAFKVLVKQALRNDEGEWLNADWTEYVQTLEQAAKIVSRFAPEEENRNVIGMKITQIFVHEKQ